MKTALEDASAEQKEMLTAQARFGKLIEKVRIRFVYLLPGSGLLTLPMPCSRARRRSWMAQTFKSDFGKLAGNPKAFEGKHDLITMAIANHFHRHGRFHLAEQLAEVRRGQRQ